MAEKKAKLLNTFKNTFKLAKLTLSVALVLVFSDVRNEVGEDRAAVVQWANLERKWDALDVHALLWGLDGDVDALVGFRIKGDLGTDAVWLVADNRVDVSLPVITVLEGAEDFVGDVAERRWDVLVLKIEEVLVEASILVRFLVAGNWRLEVLVLIVLAVLILDVLVQVPLMARWLGLNL